MISTGLTGLCLPLTASKVRKLALRRLTDGKDQTVGYGLPSGPKGETGSKIQARRTHTAVNSCSFPYGGSIGNVCPTCPHEKNSTRRMWDSGSFPAKFHSKNVYCQYVVFRAFPDLTTACQLSQSAMDTVGPRLHFKTRRDIPS